MNTRSRLFLKNIAGSVAIKGWAGVVQLLLVPLVLACLGQYANGIWMTISSILLWIDSFDMGLGNGLRNKLAAYVARDDWDSAGRAVSTTFFMLLAIIGPLVAVLLAATGVADVYAFLNVDAAKVGDLCRTLACTVTFVGLALVLKIVGNIYLALQLPAVNNALVVAGQTLGLAGIYIAHRTLGDHVTLFHVALISTAAPVLVYLVAMPVTFCRYAALRISWRKFDRRMVRELFSLGLQFFILQVSGMVLFFSSNLLISRWLSPADVTPYQIVYRYFSFVTMLFGIAVAPLWSATTDAYVKRDFGWIRGVTRRMNVILLGFVGLIAVMVAASPRIYALWVGGQYGITLPLTAMMGLYTAIVLYSLYYAHILFGIGHIRLQMYVTLAEAVCFVPLAMAGVNAFGLIGILGALTLVNLACAVTNRLQYKKIMSGRATGIWIR